MVYVSKQEESWEVLRTAHRSGVWGVGQSNMVGSERGVGDRRVTRNFRQEWHTKIFYTVDARLAQRLNFRALKVSRGGGRYKTTSKKISNFCRTNVLKYNECFLFSKNLIFRPYK